MKKCSFFVVLLLSVATLVQSQDKVMQIYSNGDVSYEVNTSQIDSVTFISKEKCKFEKPLENLSWLVKKIDELTLLAQGTPLHIVIYQCTYGNGQTGFLVDEGNTKPFYNCNGEVLCIMGGFAGETCSELNIVDEELIWEINN